MEGDTVERESRKRKATVSRPTQEDDDDFVNPPQRNNAAEFVHKSDLEDKVKQFMLIYMRLKSKLQRLGNQLERESRKKKATVSRPTQEDVDDFVNPPQQNNVGKRKATVSPPTQEGIHMSISQKLRGKKISVWVDNLFGFSCFCTERFGLLILLAKRGQRSYLFASPIKEGQRSRLPSLINLHRRCSRVPSRRSEEKLKPENRSGFESNVARKVEVTPPRSKLFVRALLKRLLRITRNLLTKNRRRSLRIFLGGAIELSLLLIREDASLRSLVVVVLVLGSRNHTVKQNKVILASGKRRNSRCPHLSPMNSTTANLV
ncbi:hypothetical protein LXL04_001675 [Taraxacum kok-saghyz]